MGTRRITKKSNRATRMSDETQVIAAKQMGGSIFPENIYASGGIVLENTQQLIFKNAAGDGDMYLTVDASDNFYIANLENSGDLALVITMASGNQRRMTLREYGATNNLNVWFLYDTVFTTDSGDISFLPADNVGIGTTTPGEELDVAGNIGYTGDLKPTRSATAHTGYIYIPYTTPKENELWDGNTKTSANNDVLDLSSLFSIPANVKAVNVRLSAQGASAGDYAALGPSATYFYQMIARCQVASTYIDVIGVVNCDSNGDIYVYINGTNQVYVQIWGYYI